MQSRICLAVVNRLHLLLPPEKRKNPKYVEEAEALGHLFKHVAIEIFGRWGEDAENSLRAASFLAPTTLDIAPAQFKSQWTRRLATCLQKASESLTVNLSHLLADNIESNWSSSTVRSFEFHDFE